MDLNVETAWAFLSDNYRPGDELFLFGFSRGAFTARALAGLMEWGGILPKSKAGYIKPIWDAYVERRPHKPETLVRAARTFKNLTGKWPNPAAMGVPERTALTRFASSGGGLEAKAKSTASLAPPVGEHALVPHVSQVTIKVVGVFDTVAALGLPGAFQNPWVKEHFSFFDPGLGRGVQHAFHALALHEDREDFLPTLFYQSPSLVDTQVLRQTWFQGCHADVGGGYDEHGLSDITLAWMVALLTDHRDGPMLNFDLRRLKRLQDEREAWAQQAEHDARISGLQDEAIRQVGEPTPGRSSSSSGDGSMIPSWQDMNPLGWRGEALHHSVVAGGKYDIDTSKQFEHLRQHNPAHLDVLWHEASRPESLLPTERFLRWGSDSCTAQEPAFPHPLPPAPGLLAHEPVSQTAAPHHATGSEMNGKHLSTMLDRPWKLARKGFGVPPFLRDKRPTSWRHRRAVSESKAVPYDSMGPASHHDVSAPARPGSEQDEHAQGFSPSPSHQAGRKPVSSGPAGQHFYTPPVSLSRHVPPESTTVAQTSLQPPTSRHETLTPTQTPPAHPQDTTNDRWVLFSVPKPHWASVRQAEKTAA